MPFLRIQTNHPAPLAFGDSTEACAFVELKSLGLKESDGPRLSEALCGLLKAELGIAPNRVYIEMSDHPRALWGYDSGTFG